MNIHPDVLAAHAQFGGDLELMQKAYEHPDLVVRLSDAEERIRELEEMLKEERERGDRIAGDWFTFCEDMEVKPDTQEAVAYELKADFSNLRARAEAAEALLKEAGEALEPFADCASEWDGEDDALHVSFEWNDEGNPVPSLPVIDFRVARRVARSIAAKIGARDERKFTVTAIDPEDEETMRQQKIKERRVNIREGYGD